MKKVGNTSFHEESIKNMTLKEFEGTYKDILKGQDLKKVYHEVTGTKAGDKKGPDKKENANLG